MRRMDVQAEVRARLASSLPGVEVRVSVPDPRPERLVVVRRDGGAMRDGLVDEATLQVLMWAPTEAEASALAMRVSAAMLSLPFSGGFARVRETSLRSDRDLLTRSPRWFASYSVATYKPVA